MAGTSGPGPSGLERRAVLAGLATATLAPSFAWGAGPPPLPALLQASSKLTGIALDRSYAQLAEAYWAALTSGTNSTDWARLIALVLETPEDKLPAALKAAGLENQAQALLSAWYSGMVNSVVITYDDALVWRTATFTKPPASCGGLFGYWNAPPGDFIPGQEVML